MVRLLFLFCTICLLLACEPTVTENEIKLSDIEGHWDVTRAIRDGRPTESLDGAFFNFSTDGLVTSNLLGDTLQVPFQLKGDTISQQLNSPIIYIIEEFEGPVMVVNTTLRSTPFQFFLEKK